MTKDATLTIRLPEDEKMKWCKAAGKVGLSEWIRWVCNAAARVGGMPLPKEENLVSKLASPVKSAGPRVLDFSRCKHPRFLCAASGAALCGDCRAANGAVADSERMERAMFGPEYGEGEIPPGVAELVQGANDCPE